MKRSFQDSIEPQDLSTGVGYVTAYSPPLPNNNYFYLDLQTSPTKSIKSICFDNSKSPKIKQFYDFGSPVRIRNITFQGDDSQHYLAQLQVNTRSVITMADNSEVNFERIHTPSTTNKVPITKISELQALKDDEIVTVQGLHNHNHNHNPKDQKCKSGHVRLMLDNSVLTDETGSVKVTLWASNIKLVSQSIKQGHPYFLFKSVRVKSFLSSPKNLTTMAGSEIEVLKTCPPELSLNAPTDEKENSTPFTLETSSSRISRFDAITFSASRTSSFLTPYIARHVTTSLFRI